jgi:hypothetical protein
MEMGEDNLCVGETLKDDLAVRRWHVDGRDFDCCASIGPDLGKEALEHIGALPFSFPDDFPPIELGDDREVAVALSKADLVDRDALDATNPIGIEMLGNNSLSDVTDCWPGDSCQYGHRRLAGLLSQQCDCILEALCEVGVVPGCR